MTDLIVASREGQLERVVELLEAGADVHSDNDRALWEASRNGNEGIVQVLLEAGANIHTRPGDTDEPPVVCASRFGHAKVVEILIDYGAGFRDYQELALSLASLNGYTKVMELLIHAGADVHALTDRPLRWASRRVSNNDAVYMLLDYGADVKWLDEKSTNEMRNYVPVNPRRVRGV